MIQHFLAYVIGHQTRILKHTVLLSVMQKFIININIINNFRVFRCAMIKMYITGEGLLLECKQTEVTCVQEEIDAMVEEAHRRNRLCSVHARSADSCQMAAKAPTRSKATRATTRCAVARVAMS